MSSSIIDRVLLESQYILNTKETIRHMTKIFKVSKSTIHKDLSERLAKIDINLYQKIKKIFMHHLNVRHLHGGEKTRIKYLKIGENNN